MTVAPPADPRVRAFAEGLARAVAASVVREIRAAGAIGAEPHAEGRDLARRALRGADL